VAIDYRREDFLARVRELTGGEGVDVVLDGFGGALSIRSFRALRPAEDSLCSATPARSRTGERAGVGGSTGT
jgi:NADPH:quinone reductase-like Zn-dependent oxidoreductase